MKPWIIALALAARAGAQIRIVDTLYRPDGSRANGALAFSCGQMVSGGKYVVRDTFTYKVVNGAVDVTLFPGATCSVVYSTQQQPFSRTWVMPATAAAPLKIGDVEGSIPPSPRATFTASQITGGVLTPERLGTGTPGADAVLRGNGVWTRSSFTASFDLASYHGGSVVIANGGTTVTGIGTQWTAEMTGRELMLPGRCGFAYRFEFVSPTSGTLEAPYGCASTSNETPASVIGTVDEPFTIAAGVNNRLMLAVDGVNYPITLSAGDERSAVAVAAEIDEQLRGAGAAATAEASAVRILLRSTTTSGVSRVGVISDQWANGAAATLGLPIVTAVGGVGAEYVLVQPLVVSGATHQLGSADLAVQCFVGDSGTSFNDIAAVVIHPSSFDVKLIPFGAVTGRCVVWR